MKPSFVIPFFLSVCLVWFGLVWWQKDYQRLRGWTCKWCKDSKHVKRGGSQGRGWRRQNSTCNHGGHFFCQPKIPTPSPDCHFFCHIVFPFCHYWNQKTKTKQKHIYPPKPKQTKANHHYYPSNSIHLIFLDVVYLVTLKRLMGSLQFLTGGFKSYVFGILWLCWDDERSFEPTHVSLLRFLCFRLSNCGKFLCCKFSLCSL